MSFVKTPVCLGTVALLATSLLAGTMLAGPPVRAQRLQTQEKEQEVAVFVTGSLIPQRVKLRRIGTTTVSPVRIIDRREIDQTGRVTTPGALIADPSVRVIGR